MVTADSGQQILALDLAKTTGWALGLVTDQEPQHGSIRFGRDGASMAAVWSECRLYLRDFLSMNPDIGIVVFEAPMVPTHMMGRTNANTIRSLIGLAAIVEEMLFTLGKYDIREARVSDVRSHFLGGNRYKRNQAKQLTIAACRRLGWNPCDDNAADALALWHYQACLLNPALGVQTSPLFRRRG